LRRIVVDGAIAIVIEPVANFGRRLVGLSAYELPAGTLQRASGANTLIPRRARSATIGIAIVRNTVAIVVDPVAYLWTRIARHARIRLTIDACFDRGQTRTHATRNRSQPFVDIDVAIVVDAIA
jgi:hypothetical protein